MGTKLSIKDFHFVGIGMISIAIHNTKTNIALQPFMVSLAKDGIYEAIAINFGILASGKTEDEVIRRLGHNIFNYFISFAKTKVSTEYVTHSKQMADFFEEFTRLSIIHKTFSSLPLSFDKDNSFSASGNYYKVA